jgi:two-component system response regulator NreC
MMKGMRVLIVDDHPVFLEGLKTILFQQPDIEAVIDATTADAAYDAADQNHPEVTVMDLFLPGSDGAAATRELMRKHPEHKVLILSVSSREEHVLRALDAGASGYALKTEPIPNVIQAIRAVLRGERYLSPGIDAVRLEELRKAKDPLGLLSVREREIFDQLVQGRSNADVAKDLFISVKTVETHRAAINRKLSVHSGAELMRFAAMRGLISH